MCKSGHERFPIRTSQLGLLRTTISERPMAGYTHNVSLLFLPVPLLYMRDLIQICAINTGTAAVGGTHRNLPSSKNPRTVILEACEKPPLADTGETVLGVRLLALADL